MKSVNEQPLISVIVPVYKVEKYLDRCVESIVNQTYKNLEIILVDDGSPDNSPAICDNWAKKDKRIKVIHKENGGVSRARNLGIDIAQGEYISFIDSDDWVHPDFLRILYDSIVDTNSQIAACDMLFTDSVDGINYNLTNYNTKCYCPEDAIESMGQAHGFSAGPCNKLYHRDMLKGESFVVDKRHEDEFFTYKILAKANNLVFVYAELYFYWQHSDSFMHTISESHLDMLEAFIEQLAFFDKRFPRLYSKAKSGICIAFVNYYMAVDDLPKEIAKKCKQRIKCYRKQVKFTIKEFVACTLKQKIYILLSGRMIGLASRIFKITRRGRE